MRLDLATRRLTPLTGDLGWDVDAVAVTRDGRRIAFTVNEAGISRLHLLGVRTRGAAARPVAPGERHLRVPISPVTVPPWPVAVLNQNPRLSAGVPLVFGVGDR